MLLLCCSVGWQQTCRGVAFEALFLEQHGECWRIAAAASAAAAAGAWGEEEPATACQADAATGACCCPLYPAMLSQQSVCEQDGRCLAVLPRRNVGVMRPAR